MVKVKAALAWLAKRNKAIAAGAVTFGTGYLAVLPDGVTAQEWVGVILATAAALGITYRVPNVQ